jgi:2-polyprenyl-6-methoxyphenol hydroxylase-like FAD-dependent oxidoreductase
MPVASVLVCGGGDAGGAVALALAKRGLEVSFVDEAKDAFEAETPLVESLRRRGVELRGGAALIGIVTVDRHVEAELSDGHVENYDAVVMADEETSPSAWRIVANDAGRDSELVAATVRALGSPA